MRIRLFSAAVAAMAAGLSLSAHASPITLAGWSYFDNPNTVVPMAIGVGVTTGTSFGISYPFVVTASAIDSPILAEPNLQTNSIDAKYTGSGTATIYVWVTETGLTSPTGVNDFLSGFTLNNVVGQVNSVGERTYLDTSNKAFGQGTLLASQTFDSLGATSSLNLTPNLTGSLYSETAEYIITETGHGASADASITISTPEPASVALLGVGLLGLALVRKRGFSPFAV